MKRSHSFHISPLSFRIVGNHSEEEQRKRKSWREGGEGGVWRLGEELAANFAISEKQNAEGKWGSRGGKLEEQGYGDL